MRVRLLIILSLLLIFVFNSPLFAYNKNTDFQLNNLNGNTVTLSDYQGKNVILFFWAIYCPACISSLNKIEVIYPKLQEKNIQLLSINIYENKAQVSRFLGARPVPYPVLLDSGQTISRKFGLYGIPSFVFIDKQGMVLTTTNHLSEDLLKIFD